MNVKRPLSLFSVRQVEVSRRQVHCQYHESRGTDLPSKAVKAIRPVCWLTDEKRKYEGSSNEGFLNHEFAVSHPRKPPHVLCWKETVWPFIFGWRISRHNCWGTHLWNQAHQIQRVLHWWSLEPAHLWLFPMTEKTVYCVQHTFTQWFRQRRPYFGQHSLLPTLGPQRLQCQNMPNKFEQKNREFADISPRHAQKHNHV